MGSAQEEKQRNNNEQSVRSATNFFNEMNKTNIHLPPFPLPQKEATTMTTMTAITTDAIVTSHYRLHCHDTVFRCYPFRRAPPRKRSTATAATITCSTTANNKNKKNKSVPTYDKNKNKNKQQQQQLTFLSLPFIDDRRRLIVYHHHPSTTTKIITTTTTEKYSSSHPPALPRKSVLEDH